MCSERGCTRPTFHGGRCEGHDILWMMNKMKAGGPVDRFLRQTARSTTGCLVWTGGTDRYGYGKMTFRREGRRRYWPAHRFAFVLKEGPWTLTPELDLDHTCRSILCVTPEHLEAVSREENLDRMVTIPCPSCKGTRRHRERCETRYPVLT